MRGLRKNVIPVENVICISLFTSELCKDVVFPCLRRDHSFYVFLANDDKFKVINMFYTLLMLSRRRVVSCIAKEVEKLCAHNAHEGSYSLPWKAYGHKPRIRAH